MSQQDQIQQLLSLMRRTDEIIDLHQCRMALAFEIQFWVICIICLAALVIAGIIEWKYKR